MAQLTKGAQTLFDIFIKRIGLVAVDLRQKADSTSYEDFADKHGLSRAQYWRIECGKANITMKSLCMVMDVHGLTVDEFLQLLIDAGSKSIEDIRQEGKELSIAKRNEKIENSKRWKTPTKSIFEMGKLTQVRSNWENDADWLGKDTY